MASTDIDGSMIVILSEAEARVFYRLLAFWSENYHDLEGPERTAADKIARDLKLSPLE